MITRRVLTAVGVESIKELPAFAWPGGDPLVYIDNDNNTLCPECARDNEDFTEPIIAYDCYMEGPPIPCEHCGKGIESAYGDPDNPDDDN